MFIIREPSFDNFADIHPVSVHHETFEVRVPPLQAGHSRVSVYVTYESGSAETLDSIVDFPEVAAVPDTFGSEGKSLIADADELWTVTHAFETIEIDSAASTSVFTFADGSVMTGEKGESGFVSGHDFSSRLVVPSPD